MNVERTPGEQPAASRTLPYSRQYFGAGMLVVVALIIGGTLIGVRYRILFWQANPKIYLLANEMDVEWIRAKHSFNTGEYNSNWLRQTEFRCKFDVAEPVPEARLFVQAFRRCYVWVDPEDIEKTAPVYASSKDLDLWKQRHEIRLPGRLLAPGSHQLVIAVENFGAHPCLLASSRELGIYSNVHWEVNESTPEWVPAALADAPVTDIAEKLQAFGYPTVFESLLQIWPWLAIVFGISFGWTWRHGSTLSPETTLSWDLSPSRLRWMLSAAWIVMAINNLWRIPVEMGFDARSHLDYVRYLLEHQSIPLAPHGSQMFQSPLLYLLAAPPYALFANLFGPDSCTKLLRFLPLLAGLSQIEITYQVARLVFPRHADLQSIATTTGGLMPMNIYMSQTFCNEPLAGCLTAWVVLLCVKLLVDPGRDRSFAFYFLLGVVWGLAMLTKVTPFLLTPLIFVVLSFQGGICHGLQPRSCAGVIIAFGASFLTTGWYYIRNWILLGRPFIGGWDQSRGIHWWQDPSYRTWKQLTSFGTAMIQPGYSGVDSFWDSLYSTLWLDGYLSAAFCPVDQLAWNYRWLDIGAWLAIVPQACMLAGAAMSWNPAQRPIRASLLFASTAMGIYLAAILDLYVQVPIYGAGKASYALGLLPCMGILVAAGSEPLLRNRWLRSCFFAMLTCWAVAAYAAYFCLK